MACIEKISGKDFFVAYKVNGASPIDNVNGVSNCALPFVFRIDTSLGDATNDFTLPIPTGTTVLMNVDWGDGTLETITDSSVSSLTHTYSSSNTYDISISGEFETKFNNGNQTHILKISDVLQWGLTFKGLSTMRGCANLSTISAADFPSLALDYSDLFQGCSSLNADLSFWDTSLSISGFQRVFSGATVFNGDLSGWTVEGSLQEMFRNATSFNQDLSAWDVSAATSFNAVFFGASSMDINNVNGWIYPEGIQDTSLELFDNRYLAGAYTDADINELSNFVLGLDVPGQSDNVGGNLMIVGANSFQIPILPQNLFPAAEAANNNLLSKGWTVPVPFSPNLQMVVDTSLGGNTVSVGATIDAGNNFLIGWGDGTWYKGYSAESGSIPNHTYATSGQYTITVSIEGAGFNFNIGGNDIQQVFQVIDTSAASKAGTFFEFRSFTNLTLIDDDSFLLYRTTLARFLQGATSFNQDISAWDVSGVTLFFNLFFGATSFNQDIGSWNVSNGTSLQSMFFNATSFDQNLGAWTFKNSANLSTMFFQSGISNANLANTIIGWNAEPLQGTSVDWSNLCSATLSESATVGVDGYDGAAAKSAYDNIVLPTGSGGLGWTGNPLITWVA